MEYACLTVADQDLKQVQQTTFPNNVVTQVVERHIVRDLQDIFSPMIMVTMSDPQVLSLLSEPSTTKRQRAFLTDRIERLEEGEEIFRSVTDS